MLHLTLKFIHQLDEFVCEIQYDPGDYLLIHQLDEFVCEIRYDPGDYLQVDFASKNGQELSETEIAEFEKVHFNHIVQLANERLADIAELQHDNERDR